MTSGYFLLEQGLGRPTNRDLVCRQDVSFRPPTLILALQFLGASPIRSPLGLGPSACHTDQSLDDKNLHLALLKGLCSEYFFPAKLSSVQGCNLWKWVALVIAGSHMSTGPGTVGNGCFYLFKYKATKAFSQGNLILASFKPSCHLPTPKVHDQARAGFSPIAGVRHIEIPNLLVLRCGLWL